MICRVNERTFCSRIGSYALLSAQPKLIRGTTDKNSKNPKTSNQFQIFNLTSSNYLMSYRWKGLYSVNYNDWFSFDS